MTVNILVLIETYWNVKGFLVAKDLIETSVLIETYWNVKKECINYMYTVEVLIETYWNVKLRGAYTNVLTDSVLIETYWNVKDDSFCASEWHLGINRNILECKV